MRLNVNHVAEIYITEQRQRARVEKSYQKQTNVLWRMRRNGTQLYFAIWTWLGAPKRRHTGKQTTIARPILTTSRLLGQFWKEERQPNLMTIVTLYNRSGLNRTLMNQGPCDIYHNGFTNKSPGNICEPTVKEWDCLTKRYSDVADIWRGRSLHLCSSRRSRSSRLYIRPRRISHPHPACESKRRSYRLHNLQEQFRTMYYVVRTGECFLRKLANDKTCIVPYELCVWRMHSC